MQYELDKDDRVLRVTGRLHDDDVVYKRSSHPDTAILDARDRRWFNASEPNMKATKAMRPGESAARHIVNVQVNGTATHRLLDPTYDIKTAFGGGHADKADVLDKVRELMRDNPPRAHSKGFTWKEDEFKKLSPQEQRDFRAVLHDEMRLNLTPQVKSPNHPEYYREFEKHLVNIVNGADEWRTFEIQLGYGSSVHTPDDITISLSYDSDRIRLEDQYFDNNPQTHF